MTKKSRSDSEKDPKEGVLIKLAYSLTLARISESLKRKYSLKREGQHFKSKPSMDGNYIPLLLLLSSFHPSWGAGRGHQVEH